MFVSNRHVKKFLVLLITLISVVRSARILGIIHMPAYSHFQLGDRIFRELASKGHEVTIITSFELKQPVKNLKHVVLTGFIEEIEAQKSEFFKNSEIYMVTKIVWLDVAGSTFTEMALKHSNVQNLLHSNETFDLVIFENFFNDAFTGFAHHYKVPYIILSTIGPNRWTNSIMGNPNNPAYIPDHYLSYSPSMTFLGRVYNTLVYLEATLFYHFYTKPKQNDLLQKYFPGAPHVNDLMYNCSLMLLNSHPIIGAPVPILPNMIEIGGYHVHPPKPLPKDLQDYLDSAKEGVVFFSMGSNMKSKDMPEEKRNAIIKALAKLKLKVLWKWEEDVLPNQPPNVKLGKWLPQQDILAHPNVKLFITHGGILSTIEAIYHGVPVLGIPVFGDQELNIGNAQNAGYGLGVPFNAITEAKLTAALNEILDNKKYSENAKRRSMILHDQQTKPLDKAIYWIQYVLRHQGAPHLKTSALNLQWYQCLLLDVVATLVAGGVISIWIVCKIARLVCGRKCKKSVSKDKKQN